MAIQFIRGPNSVISANAALNAYLEGEPAYAIDTNTLYIGNVLFSSGATYSIQGTQPANPANPSTAKAFWFDTEDNFLYVWKFASGVGSWQRVLASGSTGSAGPTGSTGGIGLTGAIGAQGVRGSIFLSGTSDPTSSTTALNGDYFLNTTTKNLFGPRTTTDNVVSWGGAISLKGDTGEKGLQGDPGVIGGVGPAGTRIFYANEPPTSIFPSAEDRREGDFYIDLLAGKLYGGYTTSQGWGAGVSLIGPAGPAGGVGPAGEPGLVWRGVWVSGTTYPLNSVVENGGSSYVSLKTTTNPTSIIADWNLVALKGSGTASTPTIYGTSPIVWDAATTTISFSVPDAVADSVLKYNGTAWVAGTSAAAKSIHSGAGAPLSTDGVDGDFWMQMAGAGSPLLFGPKAAGAWNNGVSLVGSAGVNGIAGPAGADGTAGMEWNGTWSSTVNYSRGAVVFYLGSVYICEVNDTLNITPVTTFNWDLMVAKGDQGEPANLIGTYPITITTGVNTLTIALSDGTTTGEVVSWDEATKAWVLSVPNMQLSGLSDVTIATAKNGEVLTYNGTEWVNGEITIDSLSDVVVTTPTTGQVLSFNGLFWENATTVTVINAVLPLEWDSTSSALKIGDGTLTNQALLWDDVGKAWNVAVLPSADINANVPLYWDPLAKVLSFGVGAQVGEVLIFDGVNWAAGTPFDHSRPTILWGEGVPEQGLGRSGDFYIDVLNHILYGPKCSGCLNNKWTSIQAPVNLIGPIGPIGLTGVQGVQGIQGLLGLTGAQGNSTQNLIRPVNHVGAIGTMPPVTNYDYLGNNGDFLLLNTSYSVRWYGPKAAGVWPTSSYIELKGTEGIQGIQGVQGVAGPQSGQMIHSATLSSNDAIPADPSSALGIVGDFHITILNTTLGEYIGTYLFGPKTADATDPWGTPTNLRGATGTTGATGPQGPVGPTVNPTTSDINGGLFNTGTTVDPELAVKTTVGTGLILRNIGSNTTPHLALDFAANSIFHLVGNVITLKPRPNNAAQRRSFFGI